MTTSFSTETKFGTLLRQHRLVAGLTQEALAERAGLSPRGVQLLERGLRATPRAETLRLLADALDLDEAARAALVAATRPELATQPASIAARLRPTRLPIPPTALVGREREVASACTLLRLANQPSGTRLLTVTGPGGVGKTRLALAIAAELAADFRAGVAWCELASLVDPAAASGAVAGAFGIRDGGEGTLLEELKLVDQPLLLVLDNCEHLLPAMPLIGHALATCPHLVVLATSRARLRLRGEREFPLSPLALPAARATGASPLAGLAGVAAVRLFVARAVEVSPDFTLTPENAAAVAAICRRLDGLPLALELAAARVKLLPPAALLSRLEQRLSFLSDGARDLPARQQTLRDTIAWSHGLLSPAEQTLFRRLAVFTGGFTLDAVEAVCGADEARDDAPASQPTLSPLNRCSTLDVFASLGDHSLLRTLEPTDGAARWSMLETVREYAQECLTASAEEPCVRQAHAAYFCALAECAEPELTGPARALWLDRLETEHDNLRAALAWAVTQDATTALRLAGALWRFWYVRGYLREGRDWAEAALAQAGGSPAQRARALYTAGDLAQEQGDYEHATPLLEEGRDAAIQAGEPEIAARCLSGLAFIARNQGSYETADGLLREALALQRDLGDRRAIACTLGNLGGLAQNRRDEAEAEQLLAEALVSFRALGDRPMAADIMANLAILANQQGEHPRAAGLAEEALETYRAQGDRQGSATVLVALANAARGEGNRLEARTLYEEALDLFRSVDHQPGIVTVLTHLATLMLDDGDPQRAMPFIADSLAILQRTGDRRAIATSLAASARALAALGQWEQAGRLTGAVIALRATYGDQLPPQDAEQHELDPAATGAIGEPAWSAAMAAGSTLSPEQAIATALGLSLGL